MNEKLAAVLHKAKIITTNVYESACEQIDLTKRRMDLKAKMRSYEKTINDLYQEIGRSSYDHYQDPSGELDLVNLYQQITANKEMIEVTRQQLDELKNLSDDDVEMIDLDEEIKE